MIFATMAGRTNTGSPPRRRARWQPDQIGGYVMTVRIGLKRMEFEKSEAAIAVGSLKKLPVQSMRWSRRLGPASLDGQLKQSSKSPRADFRQTGLGPARLRFPNSCSRSPRSPDRYRADCFALRPKISVRPDCITFDLCHSCTCC